jgi:hypothetical protein
VTAVRQATVETFDPAGDVVVILDDGASMRAPADAARAGGFRMLRSGQRVALTLNDDGQVVAISLVGA